jgi:RNA-directed DNA polymerase
MTTGIERIVTKAREDKKLRFTSLAHHITLPRLWDNLKKIPLTTAVGIDQQDVKSAKETFANWSSEMLEEIHRKGYKPPPTRRVYIPKPGKTQLRPISVPTVIDRGLQKTVADVLNAIYEEDFLDCSFGGRPNRSAHQAVATLHTAVSAKKVSWIYEADLKNFFGSLNQDWVERFLSLRVGDPRIMTLIRRWLKAGVMEDGQLWATTEGTVQGGPISVLISNIYLHYVLDLWIEKVVKPRMKGEVYYIRYLDDFVLCFQYHADAVRFRDVLVKRLEKFSLQLEPSKTRLVEFGRFAEKWAKTKGKKLETIYFLGFTLYCSKNRLGRYKVGMKTEKSRLKRSYAKMKRVLRRDRHKSLPEQRKMINVMLSGVTFRTI